MRNFQKIKEVSDYTQLDAPYYIDEKKTPIPTEDSMMVLRMLVRPKYGTFKIPTELKFLESTIKRFAKIDRELTGIEASWCYVTIRHGKVKTKTDDQWHFDGSSFRTDIIPERNYIWVNHSPTEFKIGPVVIHDDFDPIKHNLFSYVSHQLSNVPVETTKARKWYLLSPFCLHRRPTITNDDSRTFYRICFTDIEGRDINNTDNPLLPTPFFGRNPVKNFRNKLSDYYSGK